MSSDRVGATTVGWPLAASLLFASAACAAALHAAPSEAWNLAAGMVSMAAAWSLWAVHSRHRHEAACRRLLGERDRALQVLDELPMALLTTDDGDRVVAVRGDPRPLFGCSREALLGARTGDLIQETRLLRRLDVPGLRTCSGPAGRPRREIIAHHTEIGVNGARHHLLWDVTALVARMQKQAAILSSLPMFVATVDESGRIVSTVPVEGEDHPEQAGSHLVDHVIAADRRIVRSALRRCVGSTRPVHFETRWCAPTGELRHYRNCVGPVVAGGQVSALVVMKRDVTDLVAAEQANRRLAAAVAQASDGIVLCDATGTIQYANPAFQDSIGRPASALVGLRPASAGDLAEVFAPLWAAVEGGAAWSGTIELEQPERGRIVQEVRITPILSARGEPANYLAVHQDVTSRLSLEAQLLQAQKLESIGQLAAGIAHEINTPAQYVQTNTTFLERAFARLLPALTLARDMSAACLAGSLDAGTCREAEAVFRKARLDFLAREIPKAVTQSMEGLRRVSTIVEAMREFSHPSNDVKEPIELGETIQTTLTVAGHEWKYVADVRTDFTPGLPAVPCLRDELNQAVLNIVVNAAHAIRDKLGPDTSERGTIEVRTRQDGNWAVIEIADSGGGIPDNIRDRIFDPFFTTKPVGKGTGQGLAIARNVVVDKHGGRLTVTSEPGEGSTFALWLPLHDAPAGDAMDGAESGSPPVLGPAPRRSAG